MVKNSQKECIFCNSKYDEKHKSCPHCGFREPIKVSFCFLFIAVILISLIFYFANSGRYLELKQNFLVQNAKKIEKNLKEIKIRPLSNLSYLSKDEIFSKRIEYVAQSIVFKDKAYKPDENVYQIEDKLPWIAADKIAKYGLNNNPDIAKGPSRHSISVNNPEILISFIVPDYSKKKNKTYNQKDYLLPKKAFWDYKNKTIKTYFDYGAFMNFNPDFISLPMFIDETNARDLGYNWFYAYDSEGVIFDEMPNMSITPYKIKGCYKKGYGCNLKEGCNNYSPYQKELVFRILDRNSYLKIKMWKDKPKKLNKKPDIIYEMYFE